MVTRTKLYRLTRSYRSGAGQVFIVAMIVIVQLWLVTVALYELLSGRLANLVWLALASALGFGLALIVVFWPRRRIEEP